jgi:hypothetical protein
MMKHGGRPIMTYPDDLPVVSDDEQATLDAERVRAARLDANEADVIEQSIAVPLGDDEFDR